MCVCACVYVLFFVYRQQCLLWKYFLWRKRKLNWLNFICNENLMRWGPVDSTVVVIVVAKQQAYTHTWPHLFRDLAFSSFRNSEYNEEKTKSFDHLENREISAWLCVCGRQWLWQCQIVSSVFIATELPCVGRPNHNWKLAKANATLLTFFFIRLILISNFSIIQHRTALFFLHFLSFRIVSKYI